MLNKLSIGARLRVGFILVLVLVLAMILPVMFTKVNDIVGQAEQRELRSLYESASAELASEGRLAEALSVTLASLPSVQEHFAAGNRQALAGITVPLFTTLEQQYAVRQFHFHLPPATSFLRAHKPEKFGDDLSGFRKTVLAVNRERQQVQGLEKGVAGLGIRGISPIFTRGEHIGSVEFGMSFGQPFFDNFKAKYDVDIALHLNTDSGFQTFGSTLGEARLLGEPALQAAYNGEPRIMNTTHGDVPYAVYGRVINDFSGNPVGVLEIAMDRSHNAAALAETRNLILLASAVALAVAMAFALYIGRTISRPLRNAAAAMTDIAQGEGDLTRRLPVNGQDEVARLSDAFNQFAEKVRLTVQQVAGSTSQLATAAEEMSQVTQQTNDGVRQQQQETEQVATAINEMTATVQEVARHASEASGATQQADNEARDGSAVVEQSIRSINDLAGQLASAAEVVHQLEENSENIGTVLDVIKGVAEQTNLLALNAAIEAARAGEQGRGFAVVADEVRSLASRTQQSTEEIQQMIETLQEGARNAAKVMQSSREHSQESVEQASQAGESLRTIASAVTTINDMNLQIASAAEEQSSVAEEINRNVTNINEVVNQTAVGAQQTQVSSTELARLSHELQTLVNQFRT